jgi:hypothetical protein
MTCIDPDSPLESTICGLCDAKHELGDTDCMGEPIGYITEHCAWADRAERDRAIGAGRAFDAFAEFNRHGGVLGPAPDPLAIIRAQDVLPQHEDEALREYEFSVELFSCPDAVARRAQHARLN